MTIKELIYNLRGILKIARPDNLNISDRQIEFQINYLREKLIVQQLQKGRSISSNIKQSLGEVEVQLIDSAPGIIQTGKRVFRTIDKIPQPIELDQADAITYVGGLDGYSDFPFKTKASVRWNKYTKYESKSPLVYYEDGYVYITNCANPLLKYITIDGVWSNPREVHKFINPDGTPCYNPDIDKYPISGRMVDMLNDLFKKELNLFLQLVENDTNNASDKT